MSPTRATLVLLAVVPLALGIHYKDCGSKGATVSSVQIKPCGNGPKCILIRGKSATLDITFTAGEESKSATASVHGKVSGVPFFVPFDLPNDNACTAGGMTCPVVKNSTQHYSQSIAIKKIFPPVSALVKWEILDENKNDMICLLIPVQLR
ncbi:NPC intracellular cholesterol transporter 2-like [Pollicipes pollicipes]|uniref:NPC intracellular cholesterol transporter 2-like n=1 Tax=Pollicipes pollicipes TaxID=41117 RepID=UPI001884BB58|nr:NPC intracellular cholesterol transporter 2-like [Pollicipes pollicipes]XP_037088545.1 NPC intracellular cholesterol transporter 2-like [Pollicipes pollicipes]XP_037088546.1 NPC intracellular cholesterol transporter 2-like [Pollicipes pollicipes]XP_037088547.1 NPC intracellular cholesterol transporter 2-like [Pollicipes pollicipes]